MGDDITDEEALNIYKVLAEPLLLRIANTPVGELTLTSEEVRILVAIVRHGIQVGHYPIEKQSDTS